MKNTQREQLTICIPTELRNQLETAASAEGRSVSNFTRRVLQTCLAEKSMDAASRPVR
jgi:hypothetical protein